MNTQLTPIFETEDIPIFETFHDTYKTLMSEPVNSLLRNPEYKFNITVQYEGVLETIEILSFISIRNDEMAIVALDPNVLAEVEDAEQQHSWFYDYLLDNN